ncbi:lipase family protein [Larkinella sp. VNQ87]|uniref:lipase family protein n=1 Tax=Larkinella sp. VNQ87 TaxID=3400921 RepID=UPI003BFDD3A4
MKNRYPLALLFLLATASVLPAQNRLKPGFQVQEYLEMLGVAAMQYDTIELKERPPLGPEYKFVYRSPVGGLFNRWQLFVRSDKVAVIDIRGTTTDMPSWAENFYAAMVPATGSITLNDSTNFEYKLANDPKAMVHIGWVIGLGSLAPTILTQLRAQYASGVREFLLMGHSQGAAINFLLRSYLHYLMERGDLPKDLILKTYCSAAPKPGNLFYTYDYDYITRNGWGLTVVNAADWVPETPFSLQTLDDFNPTNPFRDVKTALRKQPLFVRLYAGNIYRKLNKRSQKSQRTFEKYLGGLVSKVIRKSMPQFQPPRYEHSSNYMRAGVPIVLQPDETYRREYPEDPKKIFQHHFFAPYYSLAKRIYGSN